MKSSNSYIHMWYVIHDFSPFNNQQRPRSYRTLSRYHVAKLYFFRSLCYCLLSAFATFLFPTNESLLLARAVKLLRLWVDLNWNRRKKYLNCVLKDMLQMVSRLSPRDWAYKDVNLFIHADSFTIAVTGKKSFTFGKTKTT